MEIQNFGASQWKAHKKQSSSYVGERHPPHLKNAQKKNRRRNRDGAFAQPCKKKDGSTRRETVQRLPGGKNAEGSICDFDIDLTDFQQHHLEDCVTVGELYERTKLPLSQFLFNN